MLGGMQIAAVVPAYNEARHIARVIETMPSFVDRIWVVDDGSSDETSEVALAVNEERVRILHHDNTLGVGAALRTGYAAAFAAGADVAAVLAGDGQMDPADLHALLQPVVRGVADYSKGNRLGCAELRQRMPLDRLAGNVILSWLTRLATGLSTTDSQCGYTAISRAAAERLPWERLWHGYGYPNDLLGYLAMAKLRVVDVPVRPIYGSEVSGIRYHHALALIPTLLVRVVARRMLHSLRTRLRVRQLSEVVGR